MDDIDAIEDGLLGSEAAPLLVESRASRAQMVRQVGLQRIQKDMSTVNQLYKDLSGIVIQQGEMLRAVDSSVSRSVENSSRANEEINKTYNRQKERRALAFRLVAFLFGLIVFLLLSRRLLMGHW
jgi:t-SNARE complex subunit (syntaxin)